MLDASPNPGDNAPRTASAPDAAELLAWTDALVKGLEHREATLVGRSAAIVSDDPDDVLLARLLKAYGARVTFIGPAPIAGSEDYHAAMTRHLLDLLEREAWAPDLDAFTGGEGPGVPTEALRLEELPDREGEPFDLVIAVGMLPAEKQAAPLALHLLSSLAKVNGAIEVLGDHRGAPPECTVRHVVAAAGRLALGLRAVQFHPFRMSLIRLSAPLYDHPAEEAGNAQMMAHCRSRLEFVSGLVAGLDVLEAGCATGIGARLFAAAGARRVVGVELLAELLDEARRQTADPRVEYRQANLNRRLPCADAAFDLVVCTEVLEHITDHETAIAEFLRVLRPGGRLVVSVPDQALEDGWAEVNRHGNPYHLRVPSFEDFTRLLQPFAVVRHYRQLDVVGSLVVDDTDRTPQGEFLSEVDDLTGAVRSVRLAVCTKAPVGDEVARRTGRLRLYRTFTDCQLGSHQHSMHQTNDLVWERLRHCQEVNRWRSELRREMPQVYWRYRPVTERGELVRNVVRGARIHQAITTWRLSGGPLVLTAPVEPGPWLEELTAMMRQTPVVQIQPSSGVSPVWGVEVSKANEPLLSLLPGREGPAGAHSVLFPMAEARVGLRALWYWRRCGAQKLWFFEEDCWRVLDTESLFARRLYRRTLGTLCRKVAPFLLPALNRAERRVMQWAMTRMGRQDFTEQVCALDGTPELRVWSDWIARDNERLGQDAPPEGRPLRVVQYVGALYSGGAERQMCNLAIGLAQRGVEVAVRTTHDATGERGHYNHLLEKHGLKVLTAGHGRTVALAPADVDESLLAAVPPQLRRHALALREDIRALKVDVLHCWLDEPNVLGAIAGLLAGVPRILMSMRNSNPTNFPRFYHPWMGVWYRLLARSQRVHLLSNSRSGARSYADWMGVPYERFHLVANGMIFEHFPESTAEARCKARAAFGLSAGDRVVCGIFRLDAEKQPDVFLRVVREVSRRVPELRVLLAGTGAMADEVEAEVKRHGMDRYLKLLGRSQDVGSIFLASDAMLLTSAFEGCPNAAIEAQYLGVPVVATRGGGTADAVLHGRTGYLAAVGDAGRLADHLTEVLTNDAHRAELSAQGHAFAREEFAVEQMVELTLLTYRRMFEDVDDGPRVLTPLIARLERAERAQGEVASCPRAAQEHIRASARELGASARAA